MDPKNLIAHLESKVDHLETELSYLNTLLIDYGFPEGIKTLKKAILEIQADEKSRL